jgi:hypothetical protein
MASTPICPLSSCIIANEDAVLSFMVARRQLSEREVYVSTGSRAESLDLTSIRRQYCDDS